MIKNLKNADILRLDQIIAKPLSQEQIVRAYAKVIAKKIEKVAPGGSFKAESIAAIKEACSKRFENIKDIDTIMAIANLNNLSEEISMDEVATGSLMETCDGIFQPVPNAFTVAHSLLEFDKPNRNRDCVPVSEAEALLQGMPGQAVTWEHDKKIFIGSVIGSAHDVPSNILCVCSRLWVARFDLDEYTEAAIEAYENGTLAFSFEMLYEEAECSVCHQIFPAQIDNKHDHYCDHLKGRYNPKSEAYRIVHKVIPQGEAVVGVPAYANSTSFLAASEDPIVKVMESIAQLQEKLSSMIKK